LSFIGLAIIVLSIIACCYSINPKSPTTYWWIAVFIIPILIFFPMYFKVLYTFKSFITEAKTINFKDQKALSINIVKVYKSMKVATINANWFCSLIYVLSVLTFILLVIIA
jgi:hypothetical protein